MDHIRILRRAFEIVRRYPVLWIFGFFLALTTSRGGGSNSGYQFNQGDFGRNNSQEFPSLPGFSWPEIPQNVLNGIIGAAIAVTCLVLLLAVVLTIVRYVSETAAIRMVNQYEETGEKVRFREGWRMGWSRAAFRMWLIDLILGLGVLIITLAIILIVAAPLLLWTTHNNAAGIIGTVAAVGLGVLALLLIIILAVGLALLGNFFHRAVVLENLGVMDSIRRGWAIVRGRIGDVVIMGLILFGLGLLFTIVMIPVFLVVALIAAVAGGLPALLAGAITNIYAQGEIPKIVALAIGIPLFLTVLALPLTFISGLVEAFTSSSWTLTYREVVALETIQKQPEAAA